MAILIFLKNSNNVKGALYRMAASQSIYDNNKNWNDDAYDLVTISDEDYVELKKENKFVESKNNSTVNYLDFNSHIYYTQEELKSTIDIKINALKEWLDAGDGSNVLNKPMAADVTSYYNWLKNLDLSTVITNPSENATWNEETSSWSDGTPLTGTIEAYGISQGINVFHPLELL